MILVREIIKKRKSNIILRYAINILYYAESPANDYRFHFDALPSLLLILTPSFFYNAFDNSTRIVVGEGLRKE
jgi:hypothetical protein